MDFSLMPTSVDGVSCGQIAEVEVLDMDIGISSTCKLRWPWAP